MNSFGEDYVSHNLPLLFVSGLRESAAQADPARRAQEGGFRIRTDLPAIESGLAASVSRAIHDHDGSDAAWKTPPQSARHFTVRSVGRSFTLPPHKAPPPPHSPRLTNIGPGPPPSLILHSPLSPLTPSSALYPDGIIDQQWIIKHQHHLPSAVLMVLPLTADPNTSSLLDNKLRAEINGVKAALSSANYKTKLVIILLGDEVIAPAEVDDRIGTIRKNTLLDQRALCFIPSDSSQQQVAETINTLLSSLHPQAIEYYRDLSKHARRKRNRNSTPQPTIHPTTAHLLPSQGWVVRYEFKLAVFAEFRQEMDAACRSYETAYESLFTPEVIESIASWSPRFHQARLLADVIALRMIRCLLWAGQHTAAVKVWTGHRAKVANLLDRRGKGTETYSWEAWQSTWSKTMADLLARAEIPGQHPGSSSVFLAPDQGTAVAERPSPAEQLHHPGYWLQKAQIHAKKRRELAYRMPEEDRQPTNQTTSPNGRSSQAYDTYLVPEPHQEAPLDSVGGFDHKAEILRYLDSAQEHFLRYHQVHMQEQLQLDRAREHLRSDSWSDAVEALQPLWEKPTWRKAGWWNLLGYIGWILLDCAQKARNAELMVRLTWELANNSFESLPGANYDLNAAIQDSGSDEEVSVVFATQNSASRVVSSFAFSAVEGHVGEPVDCQMVLSSPTLPNCPRTVLSQIKIAFEGALRPVHLTHASAGTDEARSNTTSTEIQLEESMHLAQPGTRLSASALPSISGHADLSLSSNQTKIFNFTVTPREAGDLSVASITALIEEEHYTITVINTDAEQTDSSWWETKGGEPYRREIGIQRAISTVHVLPKPPKLEISVIDFKKAYYTNEKVVIDLSILNNEEDTVLSSLTARLISPLAEAAIARWIDQENDEETQMRDMEQVLPGRTLQDLTPGSSAKLSLSISETIVAIDHELEINVEYRMERDPETILRKTLTIDVAIIRPFEANYDFLPRRSTEEWPSYFARPPLGLDIPSGLTQTFSVAANLFSFALEPLVIEAILLTTSSITGGAICSSTTGTLKDVTTSEKETEEKISTSIAPEETKTFNFDLTVQKLILGDRETVSLELLLEIGWRRSGSDLVNSTILEVPRFVNPMAEPRVLLTLDGKANLPGQQDMQLLALRYTIENPSMHFLTFNVSMDASEDYAFSGPKASAVSLVPISKYEVVYRILPNKRDTDGARERKKDRDKKGEWLKVQLNVVDAYFNQTLRVQPAGEGVKLDKKGGVVVLID